MKTYTITAERSQNRKWWILEEPTLGAVSQVKKLADAEEEMREAISHLAGMPEQEIKLELDIVTSGEVSKALSDLKTARHVEETAKTNHRQKLLQAINLLHVRGYSQREIGRLTGISHQRVNQLLNA